jgi:hypothetical protein
MNKLSRLLGLLMFLSFLLGSSVEAGEIVKMPVLGIAPTDLEYAIEIKTAKFDKVILDCQSLRMGLSFQNKDEIYADIYLNESMCSEIMEFIYTSHTDQLPVCLGVDREFEELYISREVDECF